MQMLFCITELDSQIHKCKNNYLTMIFKSGELHPNKVWEVFKISFNEAKIPPTIETLYDEDGKMLFEKEDMMVETFLILIESMMSKGILVDKGKCRLNFRGSAGRITR